MSGSLQVITGPMYAFKSSELIRRLRRANIAGQQVVLFKHSIDNRYSEYSVVTHDGEALSAIPATTSDDILSHSPPADVIGVDEVQFFNPEIVQVLDMLAYAGKTVIVSGLDMDFMAKPFRITADLLSLADQVDKFTAVCTGCSTKDDIVEATHTQLYNDGEEVTKALSSIKVGGAESYSPRCRSCFVRAKQKVNA